MWYDYMLPLPDDLYSIGEIELSRLLLSPDILEDLALVERLLELRADVNVQDDEGWTPLHVAARDGHVDVCRMLIEAGAPVDAQVDDGWTPLHFAAYNDEMEVCELLVASGADVNALDHRGQSAFDVTSYTVVRNYLRDLGGD